MFGANLIIKAINTSKIPKPQRLFTILNSMYYSPTTTLKLSYNYESKWYHSNLSISEEQCKRQ